MSSPSSALPSAAALPPKNAALEGRRWLKPSSQHHLGGEGESPEEMAGKWCFPPARDLHCSPGPSLMPLAQYSRLGFFSGPGQHGARGARITQGKHVALLGTG